MNPNSQNQRSNFSERSHATIDDTVDRFRKAKLNAADQRAAAINLGKLAALLCPQKPRQGVGQIISESKLFSVKEKRKRFFRLPGEDAPISSKDGTYNADPASCVSLAKAAGRLLSGSRDKGLQEKEEEAALRILIQGTSFLPSYVPATQAEQSIKGLLEEYAVRLAEAIEHRTRITELWQALEMTPVEIDVSHEPLPPSSYGADAVYPSQLLQPHYRGHIKYGQFEPARDIFPDTSWAEPTLEIGYTMTTYNMFALKIPGDKSHLFPDIKSTHENLVCSVEANEWLESIGFDVVEHCFRDELTGCHQAELDKVTVAFIHKVGIGIRKGSQNKVEVEISSWRQNKGPTWDANNEEFERHSDFFMSTSTSGHFLLASQGGAVEKFKKYVTIPEFECPIEKVSIIPQFDDDDPNDFEATTGYWENCLLVEASDRSQDLTKVLMFRDCFGADLWEDEDDFEEYEAMKYLHGWVDDPHCAKLFFGASNMVFMPIVSDAEPIAGAAPVGSIAASILENARSAAPESRISQLLIDRVAVTAEAGLKFHNTLLETSRASLANI